MALVGFPSRFQQDDEILALLGQHDFCNGAEAGFLLGIRNREGELTASGFEWIAEAARADLDRFAGHVAGQRVELDDRSARDEQQRANASRLGLRGSGQVADATSGEQDEVRQLAEHGAESL